MYLFFDTETSDLPKNWNLPASATDNWPRIVQFAWITCDRDGRPVDTQTRLIKPEGFTIAPGARDVHGISTEFARENGEPLLPVLEQFIAAVKASSILVAHNIDFDTTIIVAECIRAGLPIPFSRDGLRCTMKESTDFCKLPGNFGFKWPQLSQLHSILFDRDFDGAHDAAADCRACMDCYFRLKELGVMA